MDREQLVETIREVIAEERRERMTHPEKRERVTRYTTPEGETYTSVTMARAQWVGLVLGLVLSAASVLGIIGGIGIKLWVEPVIDQKIEAHHIEMEKEAVAFVHREQFEPWAALQNAKWEEQQRVNDRRERQLADIAADIKLILQRLR